MLDLSGPTNPNPTVLLADIEPGRLEDSPMSLQRPTADGTPPGERRLKLAYLGKKHPEQQDGSSKLVDHLFVQSRLKSPWTLYYQGLPLSCYSCAEAVDDAQQVSYIQYVWYAVKDGTFAQKTGCNQRQGGVFIALNGIASDQSLFSLDYESAHGRPYRSSRPF
jgi:hypothetical protein